MWSALNACLWMQHFNYVPNRPTTGFLFFLGFSIFFLFLGGAELFFQAKNSHLHFFVGPRQQAKYSHAALAQVHPAASHRKQKIYI